MRIKIITDSTADLLADTLNKVQVVPLTLRFGKDEYIDKVTIESDILPTTSQATPNDFEKVFKTIDPKDQAICITLSSKLSGTYQSAMIAAMDYDNIYVLDSNNVTVGASIFIKQALH